MEVIKPSEQYFEQYLSAVKESFSNNITEWMPFDPNDYSAWKEQILAVYKNYEDGVNIPPGMPRTLTYWCTEGGRFIGEIQLRPYLTREQAEKWGHIAYAVRYSEWNRGYGTLLLKAAAKKLHEMEVQPIFVASHSGNAASCRVIQKNGGVLCGKTADETGAPQNVYKLP